MGLFVFFILGLFVFFILRSVLAVECSGAGRNFSHQCCRRTVIIYSVFVEKILGIIMCLQPVLWRVVLILCSFLYSVWGSFSPRQLHPLFDHRGAKVQGLDLKPWPLQGGHFWHHSASCEKRPSQQTGGKCGCLIVLFFYDWFVFVSTNGCINFFIDVEVLKMIQALELSAKMQIYAAMKLVLCKERKYDGGGGGGEWIATWKKNGGTKKWKHWKLHSKCPLNIWSLFIRGCYLSQSLQTLAVAMKKLRLCVSGLCAGCENQRSALQCPLFMCCYSFSHLLYSSGLTSRTKMLWMWSVPCIVANAIACQLFLPSPPHNHHHHYPSRPPPPSKRDIVSVLAVCFDSIVLLFSVCSTWVPGSSASLGPGFPRLPRIPGPVRSSGYGPGVRLLWEHQAHTGEWSTHVQFVGMGAEVIQVDTSQWDHLDQ